MPVSPKPGRRIAIEAAEIVILLRTHFDGGDIAQSHFRTILIDAQRNGAKLFWRLQQRLGVNGGVQRLSINGRVPPNCPTAICAFCDLMASVTSFAVIWKLLSFAGSSQMRMEY